MDRNPHLGNVYRRQKKKGEERRKRETLKMSFIWKWIGSPAVVLHRIFIFYFFCGMESEVMTVRDAQERAVGSSVRECRCTYGRVPGSECKWKMVKKKKASCLGLQAVTWQRWL